MTTPIMEPEDEMARLRANFKDALAAQVRLHKLLSAVHDAGRPHSHLCECEQCLAWDAVRKELSGE